MNYIYKLANATHDDTLTFNVSVENEAVARSTCAWTIDR